MKIESHKCGSTHSACDCVLKKIATLEEDLAAIEIWYQRRTDECLKRYDRIQELEDELERVKLLLLLADTSVSIEEMNSLSLKQWSEFIKWKESQ